MKTEHRLRKAKEHAAKKYGAQYVNLGDKHYRLDTVPTGSWMLDFKSGIGGLPFGHAVEVFGANRIGKSSAIGYSVCGNIQRMPNKLVGIIASEPRLVTPADREWALKLGFNPDDAFIQYPDHAEEAFDMLRDMVFEDLVDYIMIDSLGGLGTPSGAKQDGKQKAYGISGAVTAALNDVMPRVYKNNIGLLIINQQRQSGNFNGTTLYDSPGGEALHHHMRMRIQVKPGKARFNANIDGETVMVGRELTCKFVKNNLSQGQEKTAAFNFFHIETSQYGFGIDRVQDIINVGKITGVLKGGTWLEHPTFPGDKHSLQGKNAVGKFLAENPEALEQIRGEVMSTMIKRELEEAEELKNKQRQASVSEDDDGDEGE